MKDDNLLQAAQANLWLPAELQQRDIEQLLGTMLSGSIDLGELYFQSSRSEFWSLEDGIVRDAGFSSDRGVGVRAVSGEKTGFASLPVTKALPWYAAWAAVANPVVGLGILVGSKIIEGPWNPLVVPAIRSVAILIIPKWFLTEFSPKICKVHEFDLKKHREKNKNKRRKKNWKQKSK